MPVEDVWGITKEKWEKILANPIEDPVTKEYVDQQTSATIDRQQETALNFGPADLGFASTSGVLTATAISTGLNTYSVRADRMELNGEQVATLLDLDNRRFRYLGYEKHEHGIITRERKLQQRVMKTNAETGEPIEVWEDIPIVEE